MDEAKRIERREVYDGRIVKLSVDRVLLPNGHEAELELIRHRGAAAVVPVDAEGHVWLVRQYRYAAAGWLLEVPAGKLEGGEPPETCARREIEEETGLRARRLEPLGAIFTTPGFTDERIWLYLATDLGPARQALEHHEVLSVVHMPIAEAVGLALDGTIEDAKSVCALLRAAARLGSLPRSP
jgi:ADP-ribose pyrophosphatase